MRARRITALFVVLFGFWLMMSGRLDLLFVVSGLVVAAVGTAASARLLELTLGELDHHPYIRPLAFVVFVPWLFGRMIVGAIHVAQVVFTPGRLPDPDFVEFHTDLATPAARTALAHAITLVPGTMLVDIVGHELTIHAFTPDAADDLVTGALQNRIASVLGEDAQPPTTLHWLGREGFDERQAT